MIPDQVSSKVVINDSKKIDLVSKVNEILTFHGNQAPKDQFHNVISTPSKSTAFRKIPEEEASEHTKTAKRIPLWLGRFCRSIKETLSSMQRFLQRYRMDWNMKPEGKTRVMVGITKPSTPVLQPIISGLLFLYSTYLIVSSESNKKHFLGNHVSA